MFFRMTEKERPYLFPETAEEAVRLKKENPEYIYIAGGTQINSMHGNQECEGFISLSETGLSEIDKTVIGSMATLQEIIETGDIHPGIKESALHLANRNIRNIATIGGNIASGKSSSDMAVSLLALNAELSVKTSAGEKTVSMADFIKKPSGLITKIVVPDNSIKLFQRRYSRTGNDIATVKIVIGYKEEQGKISEVRVAVGSVAAKVILLKKVSKLMEGYFPGKDFSIIIETALEEVKPIDDLRASAEYRKTLVAAALEEFIKSL